MANKGYFIITDISGYTEYLTESELDHAHEILQSLFEAQMKHINFPLKISGFRGDAIFMYTPEACFVNPQTFLETLENFYIVFSETLQQIQFNTTCPCRACRNMNKLDLKICVHYGEYIVQKLGDHEELLGADVIVPHRMLKNHVIEHTGITAYALFSDAAANALHLSELSQPLVPHTESYEHLGEVKMQVFDLHPVWKNAQERKRHIVSKEEAWVSFETDVPYPPALVWEILNTPSLEARMLMLDVAERTDSMGGRIREEAQFHCAHEASHFYAKMIDWKPFEYYTIRQRAEPFGNIEYYQTRRLIPLENGTRLLVTMGKPDPEVTEEVRGQFQWMAGLFGNLQSVIEQALAEGKVTTS
jgi:Protein of unknown function (DUF2652)